MEIVDINLVYSTLGKTSLSLIFLILIVILFRRERTGLEKFVLGSTFRAIIQLSIVAIFLAFIFSISNGFLIFGILGIMTLFSSRTAAKRLSNIPNILKIELIAQLITVYFIMTFVVIVKILPFTPEYIIPIGGMVLGNSMNISYLINNRILAEIKNRAGEVETALALGATPRYLVFNLDIISNAIRNGITPIINNLRTLGIVSIPGLMSGMIIGGINPVIAAIYQILIFFLIIFAGLMAGLISTYLAINEIFDKKEYRIRIDLQNV